MQVFLRGCGDQRILPGMFCGIKCSAPRLPALLAVFAVLCLSASVASAAPPVPPTNDPPNVVLITLDTVRADHLGCYGYKLGETPNLDALAAAGSRFANAYTPAPITLPAHSVILTTLIVVAGDHGEGLGQHGEKTHGFFVYNTTLHVPLIIKLPAGAAQRTPVVNEQVNLADRLPTILEIVGIGTPKEVQGRSLVAAMREKASATPSEHYAETYLPRIHFNWSELRGVRFRQYHFIDAPRPELYDLSADPRELKNIYGEKRAVANELRKRLGQLIAQYTSAVGEKTAEKTGLDPVLMERLKSLGYVAVSGDDQVLTDRNLPDPKDRVQVYELASDALTDSQHGRYAQGHEALGEIFLYQGKLDEAIASLRMALEIEPGYGKARQAFVKALQAKGLHQEAEEEMRKGAGNSSRP